MAKSVLEWTLVARDKASNEFERVGRSADRMGGLVKGAAFAAGAALAATAIAAVKFATDSVQAFAEAETAQVRLNFAFEKFPALVGGNVDALRKLNTELQKTTRFEDDAIAAAQMTLAQYDLTEQQLTELTPLMLDYAAVTGKDVGSAAEDLGKALLGQGRALKAIGLDFQDAGNPVANYAQLVAGLSEKVQGFAEKDADTLAGKLDQIKNRFGDLQERVGEVFAPLADLGLDVLDDATGSLEEVFAVFTPELQEAIATTRPELEKLLRSVVDAAPSIAAFASSALPEFVKGMQDLLKITEGFSLLATDPGLFWSEFIGATDKVEGVGSTTDLVGNPIQRGPISSEEFWKQEAAGAAEAYAEEMSAQSGLLYDSGKKLTDSALAGAASELRASEGLGQSLAQGMASGISRYEYLALVAAENMAMRAVQKAYNAVQARSPSRVMHRLGTYMAQGLANGIDEGAGLASDSIGRMLNVAPSGSRAPSVGLGGMPGGGGLTVNVRVDGNVLGTDASVARLVSTALVNSARAGQFNPVELTRALGV